MDNEAVLRRIHEICALWENELVAKSELLEARLEALEDGKLDSRAVTNTDAQLLQAENVLLKLKTLALDLPQPKELDESLSWGEYCIAMKEDSAFREKEIYRAELGRIAMEKVKRSFYQYHLYEDGELDMPLLNAESVELAAERDRQQSNP